MNLQTEINNLEVKINKMEVLFQHPEQKEEYEIYITPYKSTLKCLKELKANGMTDNEFTDKYKNQFIN